MNKRKTSNINSFDTAIIRWILNMTLTIFLVALAAISYSQTDSFAILLDSGKAEFQKSYSESDYEYAAQCLSRALKIKPNSAEAHYYMGYSLDRINSKDGKTMLQANLRLTDSASHHFLKVVELSPRFEKEILVLDPYSKQTSLWGSQAISYQYRNMDDSASYCYQLGKDRGGFSDFFLEYNKQILKSCDANAILIVNGDNATFPLMYLQHEEGFRTDVLVVDNTLLNTDWYPQMLKDQFNADFGNADIGHDSLGYRLWRDSLISINAPNSESFSWILHPSYHKEYILRGELLLLALLEKNAFRREVRFIVGIDPSRVLGLTKYFTEYIISQKLAVPKPSLDKVMYDFDSQYYDALNLFSEIDLNRHDEQVMLSGIRIMVIRKIIYLAQNGQKPEARKWLTKVFTDFSEKKLPYGFNQLRDSRAAIEKLIESTDTR